MLLYLHGFESSPQSHKVTQLSAYCEAHGVAVYCPQLPASMAATQALLDDLVQQPWQGVVGSSLGAFWAHYLVSAQHCQYGRASRAVLINPAVSPSQSLAAYRGRRWHPYLAQSYELEQNAFATLAAMESTLCDEVALWVWLQTGDETLPYQRARKYYHSQRMLVEQGGHHRFAGFERYLPALLKFLMI